MPNQQKKIHNLELLLFWNRCYAFVFKIPLMQFYIFSPLFVFCIILYLQLVLNESFFALQWLRKWLILILTLITI